MRIAGFLVVLCLGAGCKTKNDADAAPDPAAVKAQQELIARRDALLKTRQQLQADRDKLESQIKDAQAKGGDTSDLSKQLADLDSKIETSTSDLINMVNSKLDSIKITGDKTAQVAARENDIKNREIDLNARENKLIEKEHEFLKIQSDAAQRWKDTCTTAAPVIIQQTAAKGGNYTKKDVSDLIGKAKAAMAKKGIITADLPGPAQQLESEAGKAMNDNDMSKAYFAAAQLSGTVDSISINRAFIQGKAARLQAQIKSSKPDDATNQQLSAILTDVMQKYNDGDFGAANKRLNQLATMLR